MSLLELKAPKTETYTNGWWETKLGVRTPSQRGVSQDSCREHSTVSSVLLFQRGRIWVLNTHIRQLTMLVSPAPGDLVPSSGFCGHSNTMHSCKHTHIHTYIIFKALPIRLVSEEWGAVLVNNPHIVIVLLFVNILGDGPNATHPVLGVG